jgi:hypothetical protein
MEDEIQELLEDAEPIGDGLSNHVYATEDKVIKIYSRFPFTSFYTSLLEIFEFKLNYIDRGQRMKNEHQLRDSIHKAGFSTPDIHFVGERAIVFERIKGLPGFRYMESCTPEEAEELGERFKKFLDDLHSRGGAIRDCRISNYMIDGDEVYSIDHEYSGMNSNRVFRFIDDATLLASIRQTPSYRGFARGFEPSLVVSIASVLLALDHVILFDPEIKRVRNIARSLGIPA